MKLKQSLLEEMVQRVVTDFPRLGMYHLSKNMDVGSLRLEPGYHMKIVSDHYLREPTYEVPGIRETLFEMDYHDKISFGDVEALLDVPKSKLASRLYSGGFVDDGLILKEALQDSDLPCVDFFGFFYLVGYPKMEGGIVTNPSTASSLMLDGLSMNMMYNGGLLKFKMTMEDAGAEALGVLKIYNLFFKKIREHYNDMENEFLERLQVRQKITERTWEGLDNNKDIADAVLIKYNIHPKQWYPEAIPIVKGGKIRKTIKISEAEKSEEYSKKQAQDVLRVVKKQNPVTIRQIYDALHKRPNIFNRALNLITKSGTPLPGEEKVLKVLQDYNLVEFCGLCPPSFKMVEDPLMKSEGFHQRI